MTPTVSSKEVSERMSQQWGPLRTSSPTYKDQVQVSLRLLYTVSQLQHDISEAILDLVRELEQLQEEPQ